MALATECTTGALYGVPHMLRMRNDIGLGTVRTKRPRVLSDTIHSLEITDLFESGLPIQFFQARRKARIHSEGWRDRSSCREQDKRGILQVRTITKWASDQVPKTGVSRGIFLENP
ncbi:hypothetical protein V1291_002866 [Nitrobacteraceae bacterium AZCC 1564]